MADLKKIAEGREAEIFAWEDGAVLRLMRSSSGPEPVEFQARALDAAHGAGVDVPLSKGTINVDGRHGLIMERIDGTDLLTLIGRKPWHIWSAGTVTGRLQAELHKVAAPEGLRNLKEAMKQRLETSDLVPAEISRFALETLAGLPDGDRLCHGDFHPGNIIKTDGRHVIIDWSNVSAGDPAADHARTMLMLRLGEPPPGAPLLVRALALVGRRILLAAYERAYLRRRPVDTELVDRWEAPVVAQRLTENIEPERSKLLRLLDERLKERD